MSFLLSTTGNSATVVLDDLGARTFVHPTVNLDLELEYQLWELLASDDLSTALNDNDITLTFDDQLLTVSSLALIARGNMKTQYYDTNEDNVIDYSVLAGTSGYANNSGLLNNQSDSYFLNRTNHTGTQTTSTISDFNTSVEALINSLTSMDFASTSGYALNSNNSYLLNSEPGSYYLDRTNHIGTQTSSTISDFISTSRSSISIASGSTQYLNYNSTTGEFAITALGITDVTVNTTETSLANFVAANYTIGNEFQEGDTIILTAIPTGTEVYIHNGGTAVTVADFTLIESPNISDTYIRSLLSATSPLQYNPVTGNFFIPAASASTSGYLTSIDWNTFNNKLDNNSSIDELADVDTTTSAPANTDLLNYVNPNWVPVATKSVNVRHSWSVSAGVNSTSVTNRFMDWVSGAQNLSPYITPVNATIVNLSTATSGTATWVAEVRVNGAIVTSITNTGVESNFAAVSVNINAGDSITFYVNGTAVNRPSLSVMFIER